LLIRSPVAYICKKSRAEFSAYHRAT